MNNVSIHIDAKPRYILALNSSPAPLLPLSKFKIAPLQFPLSLLTPFIPSSLRHMIFNIFHGLAHPGVRGTPELIGDHFVWPHMQYKMCHGVTSVSPARQLRLKLMSGLLYTQFPFLTSFFQTRMWILWDLFPNSWIFLSPNYC